RGERSDSEVRPPRAEASGLVRIRQRSKDPQKGEMTMDIVRIWKDPEYRRRLSAAERSAVPASPAGEVELAEGSLYGISGGAAPGRERLETSAPDLPDERRARQRLEWWTELVAFRGPEEDLDGKLRPLGMTAGQLAALLGEREDDLSHRLRAAPEWFRWFARAWEAAGSPEPDPTLPSDLGLLECARPLLREAQRRLRDGL